MKIVIFTVVKNRCMLHGRVFVVFCELFELLSLFSDKLFTLDSCSGAHIETFEQPAHQHVALHLFSGCNRQDDSWDVPSFCRALD